MTGVRREGGLELDDGLASVPLLIVDGRYGKAQIEVVITVFGLLWATLNSLAQPVDEIVGCLREGHHQGNIIKIIIY
jgi:hypothetical protein